VLKPRIASIRGHREYLCRKPCSHVPCLPSTDVYGDENFVIIGHGSSSS
jgi:hypothetical protein